MSNNLSPPKDNSFLGTGWAFPPTFNRQTRQAEMISAEADILQSLHIILSTQPGERLMHSDFGCELSQFLFQDMRQEVITSIRGVIADALLYHEPRIMLERVEVEPSPAAVGLLLIQVDYTIRQTNTRANLVYPFYLQEASSDSFMGG